VAGFSGAAIERQGAMTMGVLDGKVAIVTGPAGVSTWASRDLP
jgi:hypothetical protein